MVHCITQLEPRGVWTLASACALHPPRTLVQVFQVHSRDSEDSGSVVSGPGVLEVILELEHHPGRGECRGQVQS